MLYLLLCDIIWSKKKLQSADSNIKVMVDNWQYDDDVEQLQHSNTLAFTYKKTVHMLSVGRKELKGIIHFIGGFKFGENIPSYYSSLLCPIAREGYLIIATPHRYYQHARMSNHSLHAFENFLMKYSLDENSNRDLLKLPIIGLSHSLGGKLMLLMNSFDHNNKVRKFKPISNIFLAVNNYDYNTVLDSTISLLKPLMKQLLCVKLPDSIKRLFNIDVNCIKDCFYPTAADT
eukprot:gene14738-19810_t